MDIALQISEELNIKKTQAESAIKLIDEGNTIPFIARYRKEVTGSLNDEVLRELFERLNYLRNLEEKKVSVITSIEEQGLLTDELKDRISNAKTLITVEDLYRPYRPKRRTKATIAKEKGLLPLAQLILKQDPNISLLEEASKYIDIEKGVESSESALEGASDIIAEIISDNATYRTNIRKISFESGNIVTAAKDEEASSVYEMYYNFKEPVKKIASHRILAINRGEAEKFLTVKLEAPMDEIMHYLYKEIITSDNKNTKQFLENTIDDSLKRLIMPAIEREIRNTLTETASDGAINVFSKNLNQLLMQPPISGKVVLGWDPAFRTGCKLSVVDETGKVLDTTVIFPTAPQNKVEESKKVVKELIKKYNVNLISLGNGTASRESEQIIAEIIKEIDADVKYIIVNEAGASVYSASKAATEEFPNYDVGQRSAISMARRLQDPLAELVKIDPKSIGVGQYQHDMNQKKLDDALSGVVESCVNKVGVDLNTASASLMEYISGINATVAKNIVAYREKNGRFTSRNELLKVSKLGPKAYQQCAGFMRINNANNPLDATAVHPESYSAVESLFTLLGLSKNDIKPGHLSGIKAKITDLDDVASQIGIGVPTLTDILDELEKPARDPRADMPSAILRSDVLEIKDLKVGMILKGTVRNIVDFGVFVDIGVHQDGLVHISQITDRFIKHPLDVVSVGDIVDVKILDVDVDRQKISLTMKLNENASPQSAFKPSKTSKHNNKREQKNNRSHKPNKNSSKKGLTLGDLVGKIEL